MIGLINGLIWFLDVEGVLNMLNMLNVGKMSHPERVKRARRGLVKAGVSERVNGSTVRQRNSETVQSDDRVRRPSRNLSIAICSIS